MTGYFSGRRRRGKRGRHHWLLREWGSKTAGILRGGVLRGGGMIPDTERTSVTILVAPRSRRSTEVRTARPAPTELSAALRRKLKLLASLDVAWDYAFGAHRKLRLPLSAHARRLTFRSAWLVSPRPPSASHPQVPDAADLPQRTIVESVATVDLHAQLDALAEHDLDLYRSDVTRAERHRRFAAGAPQRRRPAAPPRSCAADPVASKLLDGRAGKRVQVRVDSRGHARGTARALRRAGDRQAADPVHAPAHPAHRRQAGRRHRRPCRSRRR